MFKLPHYAMHCIVTGAIGTILYDIVRYCAE